MPEPLRRSTKIFVGVLVLIGVGIAVAYVGLRYFKTASYSEQVDRMVRMHDSVVTSVHFVRVADYDSMDVRDISADIVSASLDAKELDVTKERLYLLHLFMDSDTSALTPEMIEELDYTVYPINNPEKLLRRINNGWIISYRFAPYRIQPRGFEMQRTYYYMPQTGVKIKDM